MAILSTCSVRAVLVTPFVSRASMRPSQPFGTESTQHLTDLISGKTVTVECDNERSYGRLICKILLPNSDDRCLEQLKAGMAWHYKQYQDEQSPSRPGGLRCCRMCDNEGKNRVVGRSASGAAAGFQTRY